MRGSGKLGGGARLTYHDLSGRCEVRPGWDVLSSLVLQVGLRGVDTGEEQERHRPKHHDEA